MGKLSSVEINQPLSLNIRLSCFKLSLTNTFLINNLHAEITSVPEGRELLKKLHANKLEKQYEKSRAEENY
jgi:hypothetical protein